jgi:hypothetical protein
MHACLPVFVVVDQIMQPGCLSYCRQKAGFDNWPAPGLIKQKYKPSKQRIVEGKIAYRMWLQTPEGADCTYTLPETDDEDDEEEVSSVADVETKEEPAAEKAEPKKDTFSAGEIVICPGCLESMKAPIPARALRCANCRAAIYPETSVAVMDTKEEPAYPETGVAAMDTKEEPAAKKAKPTEQNKLPKTKTQQTPAETEVTVVPVELQEDEYAVESIIDHRFNKKRRRQEYR